MDQYLLPGSGAPRRPSSIISQLDVDSAASTASTHDLNDRDTIAALPHATWRGRHFVNNAAVSKKGTRGRTTWIKDYGIFVREIFLLDRLGM